MFAENWGIQGHGTKIGKLGISEASISCTLVSSRFGRDLFSPINFQVEDEISPVRERYGAAFWRAHHEAWIESELNQREYCEACGVPLKAFGNWRAKFNAEPQPPARKARGPKSCPQSWSKS
jgi:hypothetical protein